MATAKKPSAAQLAARKLFAQRAKAGTLKKNPAKRKPAAKKKAPPREKPVKRVSQATGKPPTKRLVKRRVATKDAPKGYFANPSAKLPYVVKCGNREVGAFPTMQAATQYGRAYADLHGKPVFAGKR